MRSAASRSRILIQAVDKIFVSHPYSTKGTVAFLLAGTADYITQTIVEKRKWDKTRTLRVGFDSTFITCTYGMLYFQKIVPAIWKMNAFKHYSVAGMAFTQVLIDAVVWHPFNTSFWLGASEFLKKANVSNAKKNITNNLWRNYPKFVEFWGVMNFLSYRFIPVRHRIILMTIINFGWNLFIIGYNDLILQYNHIQPKMNY